ncbi:MAG: 2-hydroxyacid dehydrogenase [Planctomycetaceae bacterium]
MKRPLVVIPGDDPPLVARSPFLSELRTSAEVRLFTDRPVSDDEKLARLQDAEILLNSRGAIHFSGEVIRQLPRLKMIAVCGIGYDAIDLGAASEQGIVVCNIPGRTAGVVAEHAFALMLSTARKLPQMTAELQRGRWSGDLGVSLLDKQIGILGTGNIGCQMIRFCRAFGLSVKAWTFHPDASKAAALGFEYLPIENVLATSDVISVHCRLTNESRHLMNRNRIRHMKPGSILINTARAGIVETRALVDALQSGHLFGAGIDVFDNEPIDHTHPLLTCPNVVLTPHSADQTQEGIDLLTKGCVDNILAFMDGHPTNVVNP